MIGTLGALLAAGLLPGAAPLPQIATLPQMFDGQMRPDLEVATFSHFEQLFPHASVAKGARTFALPRSRKLFPEIQFTDHGRSFDLNDYLATNRIAGLLVLKDGEIRLEDYELGIGPDTRWSSFSMAKSMTSTLLGAAIRDGYVKSIDDPVTRYVPAFRGGAYDGASIRNVVMMSSGARWSETYTDPASDRRKLLARQMLFRPGTVVDYMRALPRAAEPGTHWNYNTGETYVLGTIIEAATRRPLSRYLSEKIWSHAGMEHDASWWTERPGGLTLAGGGLAATLRDYGRFGLIAASGGLVAGKRIVPDGWFDEAGSPHMIGGKQVGYGYMWWIPDQSDPINQGAFNATGIFGQYIYVNPREHLVIVALSARSKPSGRQRAELDDFAFFAAVARALHE
jgi:CubicO group peptidase (beta-lactamase class C family)